MGEAKVSICIPTYNRAASLAKTIRAMLDQTFSDWEMIVCDDASVDDTQAVVRSFKDDRIRYLHNQENVGLYANWNRCLKESRGEYVSIYHDHDTYLPTIVEKSVALLEKYPSASFVHTASLVIDKQDNAIDVDVRSFEEITPGAEIRRQLVNSFSSPVLAASAMVRKVVYQQVGFFDYYNEYGLGCDREMWFRLAEIGDVAYVNTPEVFVRVRQKSQDTSVFRWDNVIGSIRLRDEHIQKLYENDKNREYFLTRGKFTVQREKFLISLFSRAVLMENANVLEQGKAILEQNATPFARTLAKIMEKNDTVQSCLRKYVLPMHYRMIARRSQANKKKVSSYLAEHDAVSRYINRPGQSEE